MIFVTVGTHEQQFNRLIQKVDELKRDGLIYDDVFMQIGYSTYEPKYCEWKKLLPYDEMDKKYREANIIITHGGPASFMKALELGKTPIVVPRQVKYNEHINDHQVEFVQLVEKRFGSIIQVYNISDLLISLETCMRNSLEIINTDLSHNIEFNRSLEKLINNI